MTINIVHSVANTNVICNCHMTLLIILVLKGGFNDIALTTNMNMNKLRNILQVKITIDDIK